jgi:GSH-dependent disulfide-bond oxidoreductase
VRRGEDGAAEQLDAALSRFDSLLGEQAYLGGADYGLADIALVPWFLRVRDMLDVDLDGFPAVADWLARLQERPAIAAEAGIVAAL